MNLILIGFKNSGKTTLGKKLAEHLSLCFFDTDQMIEVKMQLSCFEIHQKYGEPFFRKLELQVLQVLQRKTTSIIATGGGAVTLFSSQKLLKKMGKIIHLNLPKELLFQRWQKAKPSFISNKEEFDSLYSQREPLYQKIADEKIDLYGDTSLDFNQLMGVYDKSLIRGLVC